MTVAELIASRESDWKALEEHMRKLSNPISKRTPEDAARFASLYRSVCSDLSLAKSYQLPPETISYLNELVGRAHNCLYRKRRFNWSSFGRIAFFDAPRWIVSDPAFWIAFLLFWGSFLSCAFLSRSNPDFARNVVGDGMLTTMREMYSTFESSDPFDRISAVAQYIAHNAGIGLQCFALGALGCLPGLYILMTNSILLGCVYGYMGTSEVDASTYACFREFTTAHGPFELTAIVLAAAAGFRIGIGALSTGGYARLDSIRRAAIKACPTMFASFVLFCLAATIEGLISPNELAWAETFHIDGLTVKRLIAGVSTLLLIMYFGGIGGLGALLNRYWNRKIESESKE